jgi:Uma2 family endonuclease
MKSPKSTPSATRVNRDALKDIALVIDDTFLPATLTARPMPDDEFAAFCAGHPDLFFETTADGEIIVMPPAYSLTGSRGLQIGSQLERWAEIDACGISTGSSAGLVLPNGARRAPIGP